MTNKISNSTQSWIKVEANSDFPIQNLPFGIFSTVNKSPRVGVAIGDQIVDLKELFDLGLNFKGSDLENPYLNDMMMHGKIACSQLRHKIYELLDQENDTLRNNADHVSKVIVPQAKASMHLPIKVGDYTDFFKMGTKKSPSPPVDSGALSDGGKVLDNGYERWPADIKKCTSMRVGNIMWTN